MPVVYANVLRDEVLCLIHSKSSRTSPGFNALLQCYLSLGISGHLFALSLARESRRDGSA